MSVANVLSVYSQATPEQIAEGLVWYSDAQSFAYGLANTFDVSPDVAAGVISALSPSVNWERNKFDAYSLIDAYKAGHDIDSVSVCTYGQNKRKAWLILETGQAHPFFENSHKTRNFLENILNPDSPEPVTIDRHALSVWDDSLPDGWSLTAKRYRDIAADYRFAAAQLGILPSQLQAITWVAWRESKGAA